MLFVDQAVAFGGSLVVMGQLISAIRSDGYRSIVVGEMKLPALLNYVKDAEKVVVIRRLFNYVLWMKTIGMAKKIPVKVLKKMAIYFLSAVRSTLNFIYLIRLAIYIISERADIIHVNNGINNLSPALISVLLHRKFVVHFHGVEHPSLLQRYILGKAQKQIIISEYLKEELISNGIPDDRIIVIPNPVVPKQVNTESVDMIRKIHNINDDDMVFGIVGRIVRMKGHIEFLQAALIAMKTVPKSKAIIVGDYSDGEASYQKHIENIIEDSGMKERIIFTGYKQNVEDYYNIMDICVNCSISPEGFGLVVTEAMSYGVSVIATDQGAPKEIIDDGVTGYIVNPKDTDKLANIIIKLLSDDELRHKIASRAKKHVIKKYNIENYAREMEDVYMKSLCDS